MLINPSFGLVLWTTVTFILVFLVLKICMETNCKCNEKREETISNALEQAEKVRQEVAELQAKMKFYCNKLKKNAIKS